MRSILLEETSISLSKVSRDHVFRLVHADSDEAAMHRHDLWKVTLPDMVGVSVPEGKCLIVHLGDGLLAFEKLTCRVMLVKGAFVEGYEEGGA